MNGAVRIFLTLVGAVALSATAIFLVVMPMHRHTEENNATIEERRVQLVRLERVSARINDLQKEIGRLRDALAFFEDRLPEVKEIDVILREVWLIAEDKALAARRIQTLPAEVMPRYNCQPITMSLEGPFQGFYEFLLALERLPRITKVRQMQIAKSATQEGDVQVDLLMDIFFEKKP